MTRDHGDDPVRVLLVEDNPGDIRLIQEALAKSDVETSLITVTDGEEALDYLFRRNNDESVNRPDLVLLDLNVPKITGKRVLEEIKTDAALASIPVLVLTSSATPDDVHETYERGADSYVIKPVDPNEFISAIRTIEESLATAGRLPRGEFADLDDAT